MTTRKKPTYYVAIGASAGGPEALETFFNNSPVDTGLAFIVLQHLSPYYRSIMVEPLSKQTTMRINRAEDGMWVEADNIYLIPPNKNLIMVEGKLTLKDQDRRRSNLPIDIFLESLAEDQGELGIAIILSGSGSDGTHGVKAIKAAGGMVMVQDANSAKFDGMPKSASATGLADYILAPADMPAQLLAFVKRPYAPNGGETLLPGKSEAPGTAKEGHDVSDQMPEPFNLKTHGLMMRSNPPSADPSADGTAELPAFDLDKLAEQRIQELESELRSTRKNLEQLQSTNEKLQSVNEELHTVNAKLMTKNTEMVKLGNDLENMLISSDTAILLLDENLVLRQFSPPVRRIFSLLKTDIGRSIACIRHNLMFTDLPTKLEEISTKGQEFVQDVRDISRRNTFMLRISPCRGKSAGRSGVVLSLTNINERIQAETVLREGGERFRTAELEQARQNAEQLAKAKSEFLANMSHEIRTPMNAVLGLAYLLRRMDLPLEASELAHKIHSSGQSLLGILTFRHQGSPRELMRELLNLKVLVAEDNPIVLEGLGATARSIGWSPELFEFGEAVLARLMNDAALQGPQTALLLDWQLSDVDALTLARRICDSLPQERHPLILLCTARDREKLQALEETRLADGVLSKPVGPSMLYNAVVLAYLRRDDSMAQAHPAAVASQRLASLRLLVVDDSDINLEVAERIFTQEGAEVVQAGNGQQALDWLAAHPDGVDVVLMDVHMPIMDGLEATRRLRQIPALASLPVLALAAGVLKEQEQAALATGMCGFIPKPFVVDHAVDVILAMAGKTATRSSDACTAPLPVRMATPAYATLNVDYGLNVFKKSEVYVRCLRKFVESYTQAMDTLADPAAEADQLKALAHKLKGISGQLGIERVSAVATALETLLRKDEGADEVRVQLRKQLVQSFQAIADYAPPEEALVPSPDIQHPPDLVVITPLLRQVAAAFDQFNANAAKSALDALTGQLPAAKLSPLRQTLENFDFDAGNATLLALAEEFGTSLEN